MYEHSKIARTLHQAVFLAFEVYAVMTLGYPNKNKPNDEIDVCEVFQESQPKFIGWKVGDRKYLPYYFYLDVIQEDAHKITDIQSNFA